MIVRRIVITDHIHFQSYFLRWVQQVQPVKAQCRSIGKPGREIDNRFTDLTLLCCNHNDAIGCPRTIDGSGCRILQDGDILNICRIQACNGRLLHVGDVIQLIRFGNIRSLQRNAVQHPQRVLCTIQWSSTANAYLCRSTRSTGSRADRKSGNLSGKCLVDTFYCTDGLVRYIQFGYRCRQLAALHCLVTRHNNGIEHLGRCMKCYFIMFLSRNKLHFQYVISHVATKETGYPRRYSDRELTIHISDDPHCSLSTPRLFQVFRSHINGSTDKR